MDKWAYERGVELDFSPEYARMESSTDARVRSARTRLVLSLENATCNERSRRTYHTESRSALDWLTPAEFTHQSGLQAALKIRKKPEVSTTERY